MLYRAIYSIAHIHNRALIGSTRPMNSLRNSYLQYSIKLMYPILSSCMVYKPHVFCINKICMPYGAQCLMQMNMYALIM